MKEGWEYKKLGDIGTFTRGLTYSKNDEAEISNNIVLRSNNVDLSTGKLNFDELKYLKSEFSIPEEKRVKKGSLLMCMSNGSKIHLGKVALINEDYPYAFGGFMALVTPNEELNPQFFHYSLSSPEYKEFIKKLSEGANINNIKVKELELFTIPIPPLSEQQSIVDYLDSAFAKIDDMKANAEKALGEAKALFQASLKEMLEPKEGWEEKKFGEACWYNKNNGIHKGTRYVGMEHIEQGTGVLLGTLSSDEVLSNTFAFSKGDVLYGRLRPYLKKVIVADFDGCCSTEIFPIQSKNIIGSFLMYWFLTDDITNKVNATCAGCRMPRGNMNDVLKFKISYPSLSEQQSIVATLDYLKSKVDTLQANYAKISLECDALKQAILRQVFE